MARPAWTLSCMVRLLSRTEVDQDKDAPPAQGVLVFLAIRQVTRREEKRMLDQRVPGLVVPAECFVPR